MNAIICGKKLWCFCHPCSIIAGGNRIHLSARLKEYHKQTQYNYSFHKPKIGQSRSLTKLKSANFMSHLRKLQIQLDLVNLEKQPYILRIVPSLLSHKHTFHFRDNNRFLRLCFGNTLVLRDCKPCWLHYFPKLND